MADELGVGGGTPSHGGLTGLLNVPPRWREAQAPTGEYDCNAH